MKDHFSLIPLAELLKIILHQYETDRSIFGIREELFFSPEANDPFRTSRFGRLLETPIGVAAGPQTQLAQNIVTAWLTGARFIELKTVQTLDELKISKPCIDMQDEGYNCEWSQELKISQSFEQYLDAWILLHILRDKFKYADQRDPKSPGFIFNMSVGYDYNGILNDNIQWFFNKMADASEELEVKINSLKSIYPNIVNLDIDPCISDNITLSTMHGCPSDEIEKIGKYLIKEKKLHTAIKLNPTLLGKEKLKEILHNSGFEIDVPDLAFEHDLKFKDALKLIKNLQQTANESNLQFSVKLTNTLESSNNKEVFGPDENTMYMSGRALHPIAIKLAYKLQHEFEGRLDISFSGGADAFNVADITNCGLEPVSICTDLLKPGGYGRLHQYIENLRASEWKNNSSKALLNNLRQYAAKVSKNEAYKRSYIRDQSIKTKRPLNNFDCIHAPCIDACPASQDIPDYLYYTAQGEFAKAFEVINRTNPFPNTTGMICDHLCQTKCTRINYDSPVMIREVKRFIAENGRTENDLPGSESAIQGKKKVAVIGAGPSGLSCAYFLAKAGMQVEVYESKKKPGGMITGAIPAFRLTDEATEIDVNAILKLGVKISYNFTVNADEFVKMRKKSDYIYIGVGALRSARLNIPGIENNGVLDPLEFLYSVKKGKESGLGKNVLIIGGGNTAMDAARTAYRLVGKNGKVTIVYRRSIKQMPADQGEIKAVMDEGVNILELTSPLEVNTKDNKVLSLSCNRMKLGEKDESGRAKPIELPDATFEIEVDTIIPAVGQQTAIDFVDPEKLNTHKEGYETKLSNVFIGGDALRGASTAINAIGDGKKAAQEIIFKAGIDFSIGQKESREEQEPRQLMIKKAERKFPRDIVETSLSDRRNFNMVSTSLTKREAMEEASRCLNCDEICDICTTTCPNLAFFSFETEARNYKTQNLSFKDGAAEIKEGNEFEIKQKHQILHIADWCNQCGNCNTFCPSADAPYLKKAHLYLVKEDFDLEKDGYFLDQSTDNPLLLRYYNEKLYKFALSGEEIYFSNDHIKLRLGSEDLRISEVAIKGSSDFELDLKIAIEMSILMKGVFAFMNAQNK